MRLNINENGVNVIWMVVNILIHLLTEILAYCKALKVKISVHSNFPYRLTHIQTPVRNTSLILHIL